MANCTAWSTSVAFALADDLKGEFVTRVAKVFAIAHDISVYSLIDAVARRGCSADAVWRAA